MHMCVCVQYVCARVCVLTLLLKPHRVDTAAALLREPIEDVSNIGEQGLVFPFLSPLAVGTREGIVDDVVGDSVEVQVHHEEAEDFGRKGLQLARCVRATRQAVVLVRVRQTLLSAPLEQRAGVCEDVAQRYEGARLTVGVELSTNSTRKE